VVDDIRRRWPSVPRSDQQKNMRPTFVNQARQFHSIDRPRQLNIREQDADVWTARHDATGQSPALRRGWRRCGLHRRPWLRFSPGNLYETVKNQDVLRAPRAAIT
jgi:hypothetical protein